MFHYECYCYLSGILFFIYNHYHSYFSKKYHYLSWLVWFIYHYLWSILIYIYTCIGNSHRYVVCTTDNCRYIHIVFHNVPIDNSDTHVYLKILSKLFPILPIHFDLSNLRSRQWTPWRRHRCDGEVAGNSRVQRFNQKYDFMGISLEFRQDILEKSLSLYIYMYTQ